MIHFRQDKYIYKKNITFVTLLIVFQCSQCVEKICIKKSIVSYVIAQFKKYKSFTFDFLQEENLSLDHPMFVNKEAEDKGTN